jgi:uncharacterized protein YukE
MDRIMMKIDEFREMKKPLDDKCSQLSDDVSRLVLNITGKGDDWWTGAGGNQFRGSIKNWGDQMQPLLDDLHRLYQRIDYEADEWMTTDLQYDYEGEEIDTIQELGQLFWDVISGDLQPGDLQLTIDIKEIFTSNMPWDWRYPPEKTTIWVQVGNEWVEIDRTGPNWALDLKIDLANKSIYFDGSIDRGSLDILMSLGNGVVTGWSLSILTLEGSLGFSNGTPAGGIGGFIFSGEAFAGKNISEFDYEGSHVGINILGISFGTGIKTPIGGIDVSPNSVSGGINPYFEVEIGHDQDKPRDPSPPDLVP